MFRPRTGYVGLAVVAALWLSTAVSWSQATKLGCSAEELAAIRDLSLQKLRCQCFGLDCSAGTTPINPEPVRPREAEISPEKKTYRVYEGRDLIFISHANFDLVGTDLRRANGIDHNQCQTLCQSEIQCRAYTFDKWNRWCFLKSAVRALRLDPKYVSAIKNGTSKPPPSSVSITIERYRNKAFPWSGQEAHKTDTVEQCEARCKDATSCVAFTYFKQTKLCRLMAETGEYFSDPNADSGVKRQLTSQ